MISVSNNLSKGKGHPHGKNQVKETRGLCNEKIFRKWLIPALTEWATIILLFWLGFALNHWLIWAVVVVIVGSRQHALGVLGHDGAHFTAAKSRKINDLASQLLCFWPLGCGLGGFRQFHFRHHRHFGTDQDPELLFKNHWSEEQWALPTTRAQIIRYFLLDLVGFGVPEVFKAFRLLGRVGVWDWIGPVLFWATVGTLLYVTGLWFAAVIWVLALGTSFWGFFRLRTWTEHVGTPSTHRVRANWWQRMFITPHGSWSHYEHHDHPSVPFWRRGELREENARTVTMGELFHSFGKSAVAASQARRVGLNAPRICNLQSAICNSQTLPTGREVRARIADDNRKPSTLKALTLILGIFLLYVLGLAGIVAFPWWPVKLLCVVLVAIFMGALLNIGHDAGHNSLTPHPWLNRLLGRLAFLPVLHAFSVWRVSHDRAHHDFPNLRGKDHVWTPLSKEEYDRLPFFGRLLQRFYRTIPGVGLYYFVEIWLQIAFARNKRGMRKGLNGVVAVLDRLLVAGFVVLQGWGLCALHHSLATAWAMPELSVSAVLVLGMLLPFVVFCWIFGTIALLQHTHPKIKWFANRDEWSFFGGAVQGATHLVVPRPLSIVLPDLSGHMAHHVDPRIPFYNLPKSQQQLEATLPNVIIQDLTLASFRHVLATCQLYDYQTHRWLDFAGNPTSASLA